MTTLEKISANRLLGHLLKLALALIVVFAVLFPVVKGDILDWDDAAYITENQAIQNWSLSGVTDILTSFHRGLYKPVVLLSFAAEHHYFGFNPALLHMDNLLLHLANCALVFWLIMEIAGRTDAALFVALFFGIHPMHAESVAWLAERKDLLYALFFLASTILYLRSDNGHHKWTYVVSLSCFILSLGSKPMGITLPLILLLFPYYKGEKVSRAAITPLLPFFAVSVFFTGLALYSSHKAAVLFDRPNYSTLQNIQAAFYGLLSYCLSAIAPFNLSALYPYPAATASGLPVAYRLAPAAALLLFGGALYCLRKNRNAVFGLLFFLLAILPGLQFVPAAPSVAFDHYTYVPYIGLFFACGMLCVEFMDRTHMAAKIILVSCLTLCLGLCAWTTRRRVAVWNNTIALWSDVLAQYPEDTTALNNRGLAYDKAGEYQRALTDLDKAIALKPTAAHLYVNRGNANKHAGNMQRALEDYGKAITHSPNLEAAYSNRGHVYKLLGDYNAAVREYKAALAIQPFYGTQYSLGDALRRQKRCKEAAEAFRKATMMKPDFAQAYNDLAETYLRCGDRHAALIAAQQASTLGYPVRPEILSAQSTTVR